MKSNSLVESFVSLDYDLNEIVDIDVNEIAVPRRLKGAVLNEQQRHALSCGHKVLLTGMTSSSGKKFNAIVQVSAVTKSIRFSGIPAKSLPFVRNSPHVWGINGELEL